MAVRRTKSDPNKGGALQMSFFTPKAEWRATPVSDLPSWAGAKRIAIDAETKDPSIGNKLGSGSLRDGHTVGWGFAIDGGPKHYLPFRHEGGDNLPEDEVLRYLRYQIKRFDGDFVGANLAYDVDYGYNDGFEYHPDAMFRDVQIADPLINELHFSYSLANIGKRWGVEAKDETLLREGAQSLGLDPKSGLWRLPARYVGAYGEQDVTSPLDILRKQEEVIEERGLRDIWDLETRVLPVLVRMRRRGVRIDFDKLEQIETQCKREEEECLELVKLQTGVDIGLGNVWKPTHLAPALEAIGMKIAKTSKGAPQIDKSVLDHDHPVPKAIAYARKVNKIRSTFAASIHRYQINGKIHCSFRQIAAETESGEQKGVRYGRLSAIDPNLQQQPSPDRVQASDPQIIKEWRKIYIPEPGSIWGCNDYSQQEPRWTTHFAAVMDLPKARQAAERYRKDPSTDNHEMMTRLIHGDKQVDAWIAEISKEFKINRGYSKNIFLGLCYGEGGAKLCHDIGMPTRWAHISGWGKKRQITYYHNKREAMAARMEAGTGFFKEMAGVEGQNILDKFDVEVPYVRKLAEAASGRADSGGFIKTILGRQLHFEQRDDGSYDYTHKALNRVIQGSSADQVKLAIVELDREGVYLQLQVHDETDGSFASVKDAQDAGDIMRDCILTRCDPWVPFKVDTECGPSWGEIQ